MRTPIDRWLAEGRALVEHHDDALALIPLERVLRQAPKGPVSSQAWRLKSEALEHLGHLDQALDAANHAVEDAPDAMLAVAQRAHIYDLLHHYPEALADAERARELAPNEARRWIVLAAIHMNAGQDAESLEAYEHMLTLEATPAEIREAWYGKAVALAHLGRWQEALAAFEHALQITPVDTPIYVRMLNDKARTLWMGGRLPDALDTYEQALTLEPENALAWYGKGRVFYLLNQPDASLAALDEALRLNPAYDEAHDQRRYALARRLLTQHPPLDADAPAFSEVDDPKVWLFEAQQLGRLRQWAAAEAATDQMLRLDPDDGLALMLKGMFQILQRHPLRGLALFGSSLLAPRRQRLRRQAGPRV